MIQAMSITSSTRKLATRVRWYRAGRRSASDYAGIPNEDRSIIERCLPYTMTSLRRLYALIEATRYTIRSGIPGAMAECGVWRGGSILAIIATLQRMDVDDRDIYLYDTFEGMTEPTDLDVSEFHGRALDDWENAKRRGERAWPEHFGPSSFSLESVRQFLSPAGYPDSRMHFVQGDVADSLPDRAPEQLSLLHLDTDWYESTLHELQHLYPRLSAGGVLIIDDYGHWQGCKLAVDEYFGDDPPMLAPIDYTCRLVIKR